MASLIDEISALACEDNQRDKNQSPVGLRFPSNYCSIVQSVEQKFRNSATKRDNCLVDLNSLEVAGTTLAITGNRNHMDDMFSDSDDSFLNDSTFDPMGLPVRRKTLPPDPAPKRKRGRPPKRQPLFDVRHSAMEQDNRTSGRSQTLALTSAGRSSLTSYLPPQTQPMQSLVTYGENSLVHDIEFQFSMLSWLKGKLESGPEIELRRNMEQKILKTIGIPAVPSPDSPSLYPFIIADPTTNDFDVSFLYNSAPFTFWNKLMRQTFPLSYLTMQKEVYALITDPSMRTDTSAAGDRFLQNNVLVQKLTTQLDVGSDSSTSDEDDEEEEYYDARELLRQPVPRLLPPPQRTSGPRTSTPTSRKTTEKRASAPVVTTATTSTSTGKRRGRPPKKSLPIRTSSPLPQASLLLDNVNEKINSTGESHKRQPSGPARRSVSLAARVSTPANEQSAGDKANSGGSNGKRKKRQASGAKAKKLATPAKEPDPVPQTPVPTPLRRSTRVKTPHGSSA